MRYKVESIGASFSDKEITSLENRLTANSDEGWEFHSVFSIDKRGCLGASQGQTYLAVFKSES